MQEKTRWDDRTRKHGSKTDEPTTSEGKTLASILGGVIN